MYYPSGTYASDVTNKIMQAEEFVSRYGSGPAPSPSAPPPAGAQSPPSGGAQVPPPAEELADLGQAYYNAVSLISQEKYTEAFKAFKKILDDGADPEYASKAEFEMAKCLFYLKQYDQSIRSFSGIVQKFPKHPEIKDALFFVARAYEEKGDKARAGGLFKKIISMGTDDDPVVRKVKKALRALEGEKS